MSEQYAGLTLGVDVSQLNNAVKSLQQFKNANDEAKKGVESFVNEEEIAKQRAKQLADELAKQSREFKRIQDTIDPTAAKMRKLSQAARDRKSTRLNSSHVSISYAVICLKKKK